MEASCVSSSLFSTKIKKTLSLWVDYIFFQCQSGPACVHINPRKTTLSLSGHILFETEKNIVSPNSSERHPGCKAHLNALTVIIECYLLAGSVMLSADSSPCSQDRRARFAVTVLNTLMLLETLKLVTRNRKKWHILHSLSFDAEVPCYKRRFLCDLITCGSHECFSDGLLFCSGGPRENDLF